MNMQLPDGDMPGLALLAGGLATRLWPATADVPKSMIAVAGEPFIAHQLRLIAGQGVRDVVICCGHLGEQIESFAGDGSRFDCRVRYSYDGPKLTGDGPKLMGDGPKLMGDGPKLMGDGPKLMGTGGAIRRALDLLGRHFWVMYGDSYLTAPFAPILRSFLSSGKPALMTVFPNGNRWDRSNVEFSGGKIVRYEKHVKSVEMRHIDYGLSVFSAEVFRRWPEDSAFDLSAVQTSLVEQGAMAGYEVAERFYEIGSTDGLAETDLFLREARSLLSFQGEDSVQGTRMVSA